MVEQYCIIKQISGEVRVKWGVMSVGEEQLKEHEEPTFGALSMGKCPQSVPSYAKENVG